MPRILTGIQSSGKPHLGNILGAILPALEGSKKNAEASFFFIADLHTLTSSTDPVVNAENTLHVAATWLACGLDTTKDVFYRQSDIPEVCELAWYLNCFAPFPMLANAHSFKDKSGHLHNVSAGLFTYPVLMAADILLYNADIVPVGRDQRQHLEMTRDIAATFNHKTGQDIFILPEAAIEENLMTIPGTDGRKMSKSYGNYINIFLPDKELKKVVMSIQTDSTPLDAPKNPDTCNVFAIYKAVNNAHPDRIEDLKAKYLAGNFGYGHAKNALLDSIHANFDEIRTRFNMLISRPADVNTLLVAGAGRAREIAESNIQLVRSALGLKR